MNVFRAIFRSGDVFVSEHCFLIFADSYTEAYEKAKALKEEPYYKLVAKFEVRDVLQIMTFEEILHLVLSGKSIAIT